MERLSNFNVWQVEGAGRILPHISNIFGLRADDLVDEQSLLWMRVDHLRTLSPLVSNGRLTSDSGSMIPTVRPDSRKLSPSTIKYNTDSRPLLEPPALALDSMAGSRQGDAVFDILRQPISAFDAVDGSRHRLRDVPKCCSPCGNQRVGLWLQAAMGGVGRNPTKPT